METNILKGLAGNKRSVLKSNVRKILDQLVEDITNTYKKDIDPELIYDGDDCLIKNTFDSITSGEHLTRTLLIDDAEKTLKGIIDHSAFTGGTFALLDHINKEKEIR